MKTYLRYFSTEQAAVAHLARRGNPDWTVIEGPGDPGREWAVVDRDTAAELSDGIAGIERTDGERNA